MNPANLAAFVVSLVVGLGVLYANPKRHINRAFFLLSVNVSAWVLSLAWLTAEPVIPNPVLWIRIASAIAAFIPLLLWVIKDCAKGADLGWSSLKAGWPWVVVAFCMVALCFSRYFIPFESTREHPMRGFGWTLYALVNAGSYVVLLAEAVSSVQSFSGLQKIEIQTPINPYGYRRLLLVYRLGDNDTEDLRCATPIPIGHSASGVDWCGRFHHWLSEQSAADTGSQNARNHPVCVSYHPRIQSV
jgi:hypothetical protein